MAVNRLGRTLVFTFTNHKTDAFGAVGSFTVVNYRQSKRKQTLTLNISLFRGHFCRFSRYFRPTDELLATTRFSEPLFWVNDLTDRLLTRKILHEKTREIEAHEALLRSQKPRKPPVTPRLNAEKCLFSGVKNLFSGDKRPVFKGQKACFSASKTTCLSIIPTRQSGTIAGDGQANNGQGTNKQRTTHGRMTGCHRRGRFQSRPLK